jgi:hypothetical protein
MTLLSVEVAPRGQQGEAGTAEQEGPARVSINTIVQKAKLIVLVPFS